MEEEDSDVCFYEHKLPNIHAGEFDQTQSISQSTGLFVW